MRSHISVCFLLSAAAVLLGQPGCVVQTEQLGCSLGSALLCQYSGPPGTEGVGLCRAGWTRCRDDGRFGPCEGEVLPVAEDCATILDEDCDGEITDVEDGCTCVPGMAVACYTGPADTDGVGTCRGGVQLCEADGKGYDACTWEVTPMVQDDCATPDDDDCDGEINEGCACLPGDVASCYSGPAETAGIGACAAGVQVCESDGMSFGICVGETTPTVEQCYSLLDENCDGDSGCAGEHVLSKSFGDACHQQSRGSALNASGSLFVTGSFNCELDLGCGPLSSASLADGFVAMLNPDLSCVWSRGFGGTGDQFSVAVAVDGSGDPIVAGHFNGELDLGNGALTNAGENDLFLAKFDATTGALAWAKRFGDSGDQQSADVAADGIGNVFVTGYFAGTIDFGGPDCVPLVSADGFDIFVAKLDTTGTCLWSKSFGEMQDQTAHAIAVDGNGNVLIAGRIYGSGIDFGGGFLTSSGAEDAFLVKFDVQGNHIWSKLFGDSSSQTIRSVALDDAGNIGLTGYYLGSIDFGGGALVSAGGRDLFVAKLDASGSHVWSRSFGDAQDDRAADIAFDKADNLLMTGEFVGGGTLNFGGSPLTNAGGWDSFLVKFDPAGNHLWSKRFGDGASQYSDGFGLVIDGSGNAFLSSFFEGTVNFGGAPLTSSGGEDIFVVKFGP